MRSIDVTIRGIGVYACWQDAKDGSFKWWLMARSVSDDKTVERLSDSLSPEEIKDIERAVAARRRERSGTA